MSTAFMDPGDTVERRQQQRIDSGRREWSELPAKDLDQVSGYVVDMASGNLFRPVTSAVLPGDVFGQGPKVDAFYVTHASGEPVYLERSQAPARSTSSGRRRPNRNDSGSSTNRRPRPPAPRASQRPEATPADARRDRRARAADTGWRLQDPPRTTAARSRRATAHPRSASRNAYAKTTMKTSTPAGRYTNWPV